MKQLSIIQSHAWNVEYDFTDANITDCGGISLAAYLAKASGLVGMLESNMNSTLKARRRGATEAQSILSQVYLLAKGDGHLSDLDDASEDWVFQFLTGLGRIPGSRRMGEFLCRFGESDLARLREIAMCWLGPLSTTVANSYRSDHGYVPVFIDGTDIEVDGKCFEGAAHGYRKERRYQMHSVFVGNLMVSSRLNGGGSHATHGWREQLDADVLPLLSGESDIWVRADNAYYKGEFVKYCIAQGWDFSVSVTNINWKSPVLPVSEWRRSLRTIIRRVICRSAVLTCSSRRFRLSFGKNLRRVHQQWLLAAMYHAGGLKTVCLE